MCAALAIDDYLVEDPSAALLRQAEDRLLIRLSDHASEMENVRRSVQQQRAKFEELYHSAEALSPDELDVIANLLLEAERRVAAVLAPIISDSEQRLARAQGRAPRHFAQKAVIRSLEESHNIARSWLDLYQNLRIRLAQLASDKLSVAGHLGSPIISNGDELDSYFRSIVSEDG